MTTTAAVLLITVPGATANASFAPTTVSAESVSTTAGDVAFVQWTPGTQAADSYNVYGVSADGTVTLLANVAQTVASVAEGYVEYGVQGVLGGSASEIVYTVVVPCVD